LVQRIFNSSTIESIGASPAQIIFGNAIQLDRGIFVPYIFKETDYSKLSTLIADMLIAQRDIISIAQKTQAIKDNNHYARANPYRTDFAVNSYVIAQYESNDHRPPDKLSPIFRGPYRVVSSYNNNRNVFTVQNLLTNQLEDFHITNLRPFIYDESLIDPADIAMQAQALTRVEKIVNRKGNKKNKFLMEFLVRWEGFDSTHDSWLKWSELKDNPKLHEYLDSHNLSRLIPRKRVKKSKVSEI
jgi:hypothetical protein